MNTNLNKYTKIYTYSTNIRMTIIYHVTLHFISINAIEYIP